MNGTNGNEPGYPKMPLFPKLILEHMPNLIYTAIQHVAGLANKFTNSWLVSF